MNNQKNWYQSTTIQGQIVVAIGLALEILRAFYGVSFIEKDEVSQMVAAGLTLVGIAMGIYGRLKATKLIAL